MTDAADVKKLVKRAKNAEEVRLELGRRLLAVRPRWGKAGRAARGWDAFLKAADIEKRSAQRYMSAARRADCIGDKLSRKARSSPVERVLKLVPKLDDHGRQQVRDALNAVAQESCN